jgi:uncharacterized DUF497 family protein
MRIEFDPANDATIQAKHGVSLSVAIELDWEAAVSIPRQSRGL